MLYEVITVLKQTRNGRVAQQKAISVPIKEIKLRKSLSRDEIRRGIVLAEVLA